MDYEAVIHAIIDPIIDSPESVLIRITQGNTPKDVNILIVAEKEDTSRLIGRKGIIANALRELVGVAGKTENKHVHLRFESFDENKEEE